MCRDESLVQHPHILMSSPIPTFGNLNIASMQSTRSLKGKGKGKAVESDSEGEYSDSEEEQGQGQGTGGPTHLFALDQCRQHVGMYSFQMAQASLEGHGIRIKPEAEPHCSCNEPNCPPMRWLWQHVDQIYNEAPISPPLTHHEQISNIGLHKICDRLDGEMREGLEDWQDTKWSLKKDYSVKDPRQRTRAFTRERMSSIRDIMATLSNPETVTEEYRSDLFDSPDGTLTGNLLVLGDLENSMIRLLIMDDNLFSQFKALVSNNIRDTQYFRKMDIKIRKTFALLDDYCATGDATGHPAHTVIWCAQTLVDIAHNISVNVNERQPLSPELREEAANLLISILDEVAGRRNHDAYQNLNPSQRRRRHAETSRIDGNLYELLIGSGTSPKNPSGGNFILNYLQDLPEARSHLEGLEHILACLVTKGWGPAPRAYTNKLKRIIDHLRGSAGPSPGSSVGKPIVGRPGDGDGAGGAGGPSGGPSTSSGKRPAGSMGGRAKRMK